MLAQIRKVPKATGNVLLAIGCALGWMLTSCASEKEHVALVDDPEGKKESSIPWNKQEKWENTGPLSGLTDRR